VNDVTLCKCNVTLKMLYGINFSTLIFRKLLLKHFNTWSIWF